MAYFEICIAYIIKVCHYVFGFEDDKEERMDEMPAINADGKSKLSRLASENGFSFPRYETWQEGPEHAPLHSARVTMVIGDEKHTAISSVPHRKKKDAEKEAAAHLWNAIKDLPYRQLVEEDSVTVLERWLREMGQQIPRYHYSRRHVDAISCRVHITLRGKHFRWDGDAATRETAKQRAARKAVHDLRIQ